MASMSDKLSSNMDFSAFSKAKDLQKRLLFTLFALIVFRLGTYIPLPGINPTVLNEFFSENSGGLLGMFNAFTGGALSRMSILALNIMPYISTSLISPSVLLKTTERENLSTIKTTRAPPSR